MSSNIPIVQGTPVDYHNVPGASASQTDYAAAPSDEQTPFTASAGLWEDDNKIYSTDELRAQRLDPPRQYKDAFWAVAFVVQLLGVMALCVVLLATGNGTDMSNNNNNGYSTSYGGVYTVVGVGGFLAIGLSCASLSFMIRNAQMLVQSALMFSIATSLFMGVVGFLTGNLLMGIIGLASGLIGCCYAYFVWKRIPFAAANLETALSAVKVNMGLLVLALLMSVAAMGWSILWVLGVGSALNSDSLFIVFLLFLNYYWTHEVLRNTVHVTTAVRSVVL
jgi:hypothetical protein